MTDQTIDKSKKLTFKNVKLYFNNPLGNNNITKELINTSKTVVEVKKSGFQFNTLSLQDSCIEKDNLSSISNEELNKRLILLQNIDTFDKLKQKDLFTDYFNNNVSVKSVKYDNNLIIDDVLDSSSSKYSSDSNTSEVQKDTLDTIKPIKVSILDKSTTNNIFNKNKSDDIKLLLPKNRVDEVKKLKKADILNMLDIDIQDKVSKTRSLASLKRARAKDKRKLQQVTSYSKICREVIIPDIIAIGELASRMSERVGTVIQELMHLGIVATASHTIDSDTAELIVTTLGHSVKRLKKLDIERVLVNTSCNDNNNLDLQFRAPVVTVMGHVDHGKTSLLDALRSTNLVSKEIGGITQYIGAYKINVCNNRFITFIDTPGHEAFSEMRVRGARITDIVIIVVAADDGIKPQTVEAINHAKAANVPIIIAINKIDKPDINIDKIKNELLIYNIIPEDLGGDTILVLISALKKINLDVLKDSILLLSDILELKVNFNCLASGVVIESRKNVKRGILTTLLVQSGILKTGQIVIIGTKYGKIRSMYDDTGLKIDKAEPSTPVIIYGLNDIPHIGELFNVVLDEKRAKDIVNYRLRLIKDKNIGMIVKKPNVEDLFLKASGIFNVKELLLIIKADTQGSIEAIMYSLQKLSNDLVKIRIIHQAIGNIVESDIILSKSSNAIIIAFNVKSSALNILEKDYLNIKYYSIIYHLIDDMKILIDNMYIPIIKEQYLGTIEIREIFTISKVGKIAGSFVIKGIIKKNSRIRLLRNNTIIHEGKLKFLKRFKDEVKEVREGFECGVSIENYQDIQSGDIIEAFE